MDPQIPSDLVTDLVNPLLSVLCFVGTPAIPTHVLSVNRGRLGSSAV